MEIGSSTLSDLSDLCAFSVHSVVTNKAEGFFPSIIPSSIWQQGSATVCGIW